MRLERLKIQSFRNLRDFEITFTRSALDVDGQEREFKSHAVIGPNGSGKSNLIEAIVTIFRDLDLNQKTDFAYELDYTCRGHRIHVDTMDGENRKVTITERDTEDPKQFAISHLSRFTRGHISLLTSSRIIQDATSVSKRSSNSISNGSTMRSLVVATS